MCQSARLYCRPARHVRCRNAEICRQSQCHALHTMPEYENQSTPMPRPLTIFIVFNKLASQLTADKLVDLAVIPVIFAMQLLVSWLSAISVSWAFGFKKRPRNFVVAMGVCRSGASSSDSVAIN